MKPIGEPLKASLEALRYRGASPLFHDLRLIYTDLLAGDRSALDRLASVVRHATGIHYQLTVNPSLAKDLYIVFLPVDINGILRAPAYQKLVGAKVTFGDLEPWLHQTKGWTDDRGRVHGVYRQFPCEMVITEGMLSDPSFTPGELAAATLHEIGHVYSYFDTLGRTLVSAMAVQYTQRLLSQTDDLSKRTHVLKEAKKLLQLRSVDPDALAKEPHPETVEIVLLRDVVETLQADMGNASLFNGEVETMADSYAVRSGAASELMSLYLKLAQSGHALETRSRSTYILVEGLKTGFLLATAMNPVLLGLMGLFAGLYLAIQWNNPDHRIERNTPTERVEGVHHELVQLLKDRSLAPELRQTLLTDLQFVSGVREQMVERHTLLSQLWTTLIPGKRKAYQQVQLQRDLARLIDNDLFVQAARLKLLTHPSP